MPQRGTKKYTYDIKINGERVRRTLGMYLVIDRPPLTAKSDAVTNRYVFIFPR